MTDKNALNIYLLCTKLLEELDESQTTSKFKQKFKFHTKGLIKEIENFDKLVFNEEEANSMMEFLNRKTKELNLILKK